MYSIRALWQVQAPILESLRLLLTKIRKACPQNHRIIDLGLISTESGLEVVVYFKKPALNIFSESYQDLPQNKLTIRLQPDEGIDIESVTHPLFLFFAPPNGEALLI